MGGEEVALSGPDLRQGVPFTALVEGEMLLGHADGEPVLVARQGDEVFAIGASCTHYGVSLAGGILVDGTVRCPAHHAAFDLRTGEAVRPPALNPVACWTVERRGDQVYVTGKREEAPARQASVGTGIQREPASVVIVGAGAAGSAAAETLRREGYQGRITMIGADDSVPYDRPNLSKDYLAGDASEEWIPLRPPEFYAEQGIDLALGIHTTSIDTAGKRILASSGESYEFDALLIATGADPIQLPIPGSDLPHVYYLRTLADSRAIIASAENARRVVVMGASFIGLEVAASLRAREIEVHVVGPESRPLERVLGPQMGDFIRTLHEEHGVTFHLEQTAARIDADAVTLHNGKSLPADLVVIGAGVRPALTLAQQAGLAMDRGVVVNEYLETSTPGIFAAGDIARWPDPHTGERIRVEHWVVAQRQGQTAARNMLGRRERFDAVPFFWSNHYDVSIHYVGHAERWDRVEITGSVEDQDCSIAYRLGDRVLAVATVSRERVNLQAEAAMERLDWMALDRLVSSQEQCHHA